jgi:hypothetical protein
MTAVRSTATGLLIDCWADVDRLVLGIDPQLAELKPGHGSSVAWTIGHITNQVDTWINGRFADRTPHSLIGRDEFRRGGSGAAENWIEILRGVSEVRRTAAGFLGDIEDRDLETRIPYDGSIIELRQTGLTLRYALARIVSHHYFHLGEMAWWLGSRGVAVGDYPGPLINALSAG